MQKYQKCSYEDYMVYFCVFFLVICGGILAQNTYCEVLNRTEDVLEQEYERANQIMDIESERRELAATIDDGPAKNNLLIKKEVHLFDASSNLDWVLARERKRLGMTTMYDYLLEDNQSSKNIVNTPIHQVTYFGDNSNSPHILQNLDDFKKDSLLLMQAAESYYNAAELTPYEYDSDEHVEYLQRSLDCNVLAALRAPDRYDYSECSTYNVGFEIYRILETKEECLPDLEVKAITSDDIVIPKGNFNSIFDMLENEGSPLSYDLALEWFEKSEEQLSNETNEEVLKEITWLRPSLILWKGACFMQLGKIDNALNCFNQLKNNYEDTSYYKFHLQNILKNPIANEIRNQFIH